MLSKVVSISLVSFSCRRQGFICAMRLIETVRPGLEMTDSQIKSCTAKIKISHYVLQLFDIKANLLSTQWPMLCENLLEIFNRSKADCFIETFGDRRHRCNHQRILRKSLLGKGRRKAAAGRYDWRRKGCVCQERGRDEQRTRITAS